MKPVRHIITLLFAGFVMVMLGGYPQLQYHHHDCLGRICLAISDNTVDDDDSHDSDASHGGHRHDHSHPCPNGHEYEESQSEPGSTYPAFVDLNPVLASVAPPITTSGEVVYQRCFSYIQPIYITPTGRKAPPIEV